MTSPFPGFVHAATAGGAIELRWTPPSGEQAGAIARAHAVVVLRVLGPEDEDALWAGAFDNDAIRFPVDPRAGRATVFAPADRPLTVGLAFRDARGAPLAPPRVEVSAAACGLAHGGDAPQGRGVPAARALETSEVLPPAAPVEMVFAEPPGGSRPPDLAALARRVAAHVAGASPPPGPTSSADPGGSFGARGRWYPIHLTWPAVPPPAQPLRLVRRARFMDAATVAGWASAPPEDATPLPAHADGLIDATVLEGEVRFYVVLAGPAPWRPLPLAPAPPPFGRPRRPHLIGDVAGVVAATVRARLEALRRQATPGADLAVQIELLEALAQHCDAPTRSALLAQLQAVREAPLF